MFIQSKLCTFLAGLALLMAIGIGPVAADEPTSGNDDEDTGESEMSAEERLLEKAADISERVADIRGLPLKASIPKGVQNREELRAMLVEHFEEEIPEEDFVAEALVYERLGLFEEDFEYREMMLDLYTEQIAGFYDQEEGELYIMEGLPELLQRSTMAHEIFHAIQDQHFDIGSLLAPFSSRENQDFFLARMALIEGDATVLMFDFEMYEAGHLPQNRARSFIDIPMMAAVLLELDPTELSAAERLDAPDALEVGGDPVPSLTDSVLGSAPLIIRDTLMFPYMEGMKFVIRARASRTWQEFDEIYENPPVSTAQILHPELYFDEVYPVEVRFDAASALPDHEMIYEAIFGELQIRSWLNTHFEELELDAAGGEIAAGWRGDHLRGYRGPDGEAVVVHLSTWDSIEKAEAFAEALDETARLRHEAESSHQVGAHGESWCIRPGTDEIGERIYVERWGDMVLYIEGAPSRINDQARETDPTLFLVRDAVWESHRRIPFEEVLEQRKGDSEESEESDEEPADASNSDGEASFHNYGDEFGCAG